MKHTKLSLVALPISLYNTMYSSAVADPVSSLLIPWITDMVEMIAAMFIACAQCANRCPFNAANLLLLLHQVPSFLSFVVPRTRMDGDCGITASSVWVCSVKCIVNHVHSQVCKQVMWRFIKVILIINQILEYIHCIHKNHANMVY